METGQQCSLKLGIKLEGITVVWDVRHTVPGSMITNCFHARHLTVLERQEFILKGEARKLTHTIPSITSR